MVLWLYGGLFVHENGKGVFYMMGANGALLFTLLIYAAVICIVVRIIKYLIRYGIDYYFEKLSSQKPSPSGEGGASAPNEGK